MDDEMTTINVSGAMSSGSVFVAPATMPGKTRVFISWWGVQDDDDS